ncbi:MAG: hypothetical protein NTY12_00840 [Candidatus Falkowbacteria bacterium]|nr:hypothetical protein [Candidatus Falkowbacteria bacterium]
MTDDRKAEAGAIFMADGSVSIIGVGDEINEYDYSSAWHLISLATTGVKMTLPAVPTSDLLGIDEIKKLSSDFKTRLQGWVDLFSLIPGVKASLYNGDNPDNLIDLRIPSSCKHLISMQSDDYDDFYLEKDGSVCRCDYSEGEESEVYEEWLKDFDQEKETWASFYQKVVSLFKEYTNILPVSKE